MPPPIAVRPGHTVQPPSEWNRRTDCSIALCPIPYSGDTKSHVATGTHTREISGLANVGHVPTLPRPGWVVLFAQIRRVFWSSRGGGNRLHEPEGTSYIFYKHITKMRLSTADCIYGFWGLCPQTPTGALPLDTAGDFRPQAPCAYPTSKPWLRHCVRSINVQQWTATI